MEPNAARFPFPLPPRTIGEQKAKVKSFKIALLLVSREEQGLGYSISFRASFAEFSRR